MMKRISTQFASRSIIFLLSVILVYHLLIISSIIPYDAVWGGRLESKGQMIRLEIFSISINLLILGATLLRATKSTSLLLRMVFFLFSGLFALNTLGNIASKNMYEAVIFTPLTMILAVLCFRLGMKDLQPN